VAQNVPPHDCKSHETFDLSIGPHVFPETALFEIAYTYDNDPVLHTPPSGFATVQLLNMVQDAAAQNPELNLILEHVRTEPDYDVHLQRLGHIIQTMFPAYANTTSSDLISHARRWDLVIEFKEKPFDRWIFPRGAVHLDHWYDTHRGRRFDITITTVLPYTQEQIHLDLQKLEHSSLIQDSPSMTAQPVKFHWMGVSQAVHELLTRWSLSDLPQHVLSQSAGQVRKIPSNTRFSCKPRLRHHTRYTYLTACPRVSYSNRLKR
jgi:hypothetical protein